MICETIWASMGVSEFTDKCTINVKCNIVSLLDVVHLHSLIATMVLVANRLL